MEPSDEPYDDEDFEPTDDELRAERDELLRTAPQLPPQDAAQAWASAGITSRLLFVRQDRPEDLDLAAHALERAFSAAVPLPPGGFRATALIAYGHVRGYEYERDGRPELLADAAQLLTDGLADLAAVEPADRDEDDGELAAFARELLVDVTVARCREAPEDRELLDAALPLLHAALAEAQEAEEARETEEAGDATEAGELGDVRAGDIAALHETLADFHFQRCCLIADWSQVEDARTSAAHYRAALAAAPPGSDLPLLRQGLSIALLMLARGTDDQPLLKTALREYEQALAGAREQEGGQDPPWRWVTGVEMAYARALLWAKSGDRAQLDFVERDIEPLLARPGALDELAPDYLDVFGRMLYDRAADRDDGPARDRAVAALRQAVARWDPEVDGSVLGAAFALATFQQSRFESDPDPARLADIVTGARTVLDLPEIDEERRRLARMMLAGAQHELAGRGLAEKDPQLFEQVAQDFQKMLDDNEETGPNFDESGMTALEGELASLRRMTDGFDRLYARWLAMDPADPTYGPTAGALLRVVIHADPHGTHVTPQQADALFRAAIDSNADPAWQVGMRGLASVLRVRNTTGVGGAGLQDAVDLAEEAAAFSGEDSRLLEMTGVVRFLSLLQRGQYLGGMDDVESALAAWRRVRETPLFSPYMRRLFDAQYAAMSIGPALARGDLREVDRLIGEVTATYRELKPDDSSRAEFWTLLENARMQRNGLAEERGEPWLPAPSGSPTAAELRRMAAALPRDHRAWVLGDNGVSRCGTATMARDPGALKDAMTLVEEALEFTDVHGDSWLRYTSSLGVANCAHAQLARDPRSLERGIELLEQVREFTGGPEHRLWANAGISLGTAYRLRAKVYGSATATAAEDRRRSRRIGLDSLRGHTWATLLQAGTAHAAQTAAKATEVALDVAGWCLEDGVPQEAVRALDSCRGLVLHAATTSMTVPDRLTAAGREDLAGQWREQDRGGSADEADSGVSSELRRRVLELLTGPRADGQPQNRLLDPPEPAEIGAALRTLGADALAYLVPAAEDRIGAAVVVTADGRTHHLPLQLLREQAGPIQDYQPMPGGRDMGPVPSADDKPPAPLRKQLDRLCAWAWYAAMKPLLEALGAPDRKPSLILVPMGAFGIVPWHAAWEPGLRGTRRYAVQQAEISYAASARLLCDVTARPEVPYNGSALVVGNPTGDLRYAGEEADAVQRSFYPAGRFLGQDATPGEVLNWLRDRGSSGGVLHLACHGTVAENRRHSAYLALSGGELSAEELTEAAWAHDGSGGGPELVVLAACRSHVSGRGHNEAYTLATAFLVAGAHSVVGSLWPVPDDATSVLMYMTHHFLRREAQPPGRALRRAQLWMLDPARELPEDMPEALRRRAGATDPDDLPAWAGFTHLGR